MRFFKRYVLAKQDARTARARVAPDEIKMTEGSISSTMPAQVRRSLFMTWKFFVGVVVGASLVACDSNDNAGNEDRNDAATCELLMADGGVCDVGSGGAGGAGAEGGAGGAGAEGGACAGARRRWRGAEGGAGGAGAEGGAGGAGAAGRRWCGVPVAQVVVAQVPGGAGVRVPGGAGGAGGAGAEGAGGAGAEGGAGGVGGMIPRSGEDNLAAMDQMSCHAAMGLFV